MSCSSFATLQTQLQHQVNKKKVICHSLHTNRMAKGRPREKGNRHKIHKDTNLPTFGGMDAYKEKEHKPPQQMHA
jgi:hypothetical protein